MKLQTIQIPCQPTAANDRRQISNLHVLEPDGKIRHFQGTTLSDGALQALLNLVAIALERVRTEEAANHDVARFSCRRCFHCCAVVISTHRTSAQ